MQFSKVQRPRKTDPLPLFSMRVSAGFPNSVDDSVEETLDLSKFLIKRPQSTFFVRVEGDSMVDASINPGDLLVVDRSITARNNDIVIANVAGEFTVKVFTQTPSLQLVSRNRRSPVEIKEPFEIWGVVLWVIHSAR